MKPQIYRKLKMRMGKESFMKKSYKKNEKTRSKASKKKIPPAYITYALADREKVDPETNTTTPSIENVEEMRKWSEVNTL